MSGCVYEGTKAAREKLQAAAPPAPSPDELSCSFFPTGKLNVSKKLWSCSGILTPGPREGNIDYVAKN